MTPDDLCDAPLRDVARALRRRAVSPVDLVRAYLARIEKTKRLRAFITVTGQEALRDARNAERRLRAGQDAPLLGVPIAVKDLIATRGVRTTAGSRILANWIPSKDATAVARLRQAGAVMLGKLNLHEFAYGVSTSNPWWGIARNPWDEDRIPGGSSGGSAIAVVAGLCAGSLGSDSGGSIRIPAALCGCVGLKPTYGLVPTDGVLPLGPSLDHVGPISRTVDDAQLLLEVISQNQVARRSIKGLVVGVPNGFFTQRVEPGVARVVRAAIAGLRSDGARIRSVALPSMAWSVAVQLVTLRAEAAAAHARWFPERSREYGLEPRTRLQLGRLVSGLDYLLAQRLRAKLKEDLKTAFDDVHVIATPTVPIVAPLIAQRDVNWRSGNEPVDGALVRFTSPFNLTGAPALSVPCGLSQGLPVGIQVVARWNDERTVLAAGRAVERRTGRMSPPVDKYSGAASK
jgi:aspartyl-tRNA(Asn)/glutamyl-tRNA(Gln) amidotransferase subunit A